MGAITLYSACAESSLLADPPLPHNWVPNVGVLGYPGRLKKESHCGVNLGFSAAGRSASKALTTDSFLEALFIVTPKALLANQFLHTKTFLFSDIGVVLKDPNKFSAVSV